MVGKEFDDRFSYMNTFLGYFNKYRVGNKELDEINFKFLSKAMKKILEYNDIMDIDYNLCDLIIILSSTFYMVDPETKTKKIYINELIKNSPIMQKREFWFGLTKFELNEEIQQQNKEEDILKEGNISEDKINNSVIAKIMSVSYNIIQFMSDSKLFNEVLFNIFKYFSLKSETRKEIIEMIESQLKDDHPLKLEKELLLESNPNQTPEKTDNK